MVSIALLLYLFNKVFPIKIIYVVKVTTLEPFDKKIVAELGEKLNIYHKFVLVMKYSTQVYYNIRMILGLGFI